MSARRVVITGLGPVSSIGVGREAWFAALARGDSGIRPVPFPRLGERHAAAIAGFDVKDYLETEKNYLDRASELAFAAISLALEDANIDPASLAATRTALLLGTAFGNADTLALFFHDFIEKGPRLVKPVLFPHTYSNTTISLLAIEYAVSGYHVAFASGAVASSLALLEAFDLIRSGRVDRALAGGFEALSEVAVAGSDQAGWLAPAAAPEPRPFDRDADGRVPGEGAAVLVLEDLDHARERGAAILGEIVAGATAADSSVRDPQGGAGIGRLIGSCRGAASPSCGPLDVIVAAAAGDPRIDAAEARAIAAAFPQTCPPVTSVKGLIGETWGASGALQAAALLGAMATSTVPPVRRLDHPSVELPYVRGAARPMAVSGGLISTIDPGGSAVCMEIRALA